LLFKPAVLFKLSRWLLVGALCVSLGFHWGLLQSVAWVGMMVNYSCQGSLKDAAAKTFDGQHPCPLCKLVREGKKSEKKPEAQQNVKQLDLFAGHAMAFDFPPLPGSAFSVPQSTPSRTDIPLLPPPRSFPG
jgi:hypothetical protein